MSKGHRLRNQKYVNKIKLDNGCIQCGYNDNAVALQFDHIDRSRKAIAVSTLVNKGMSIELIDIEVAKCQVLCANCHSIKTQKDLK